MTFRGLVFTMSFAIAAQGTFAGESAAIDIERLMMPGPVSEAHAKTENECSKCHSPFEAGKEADLCMFCHEEIATDRKANQGFHGLDRGAATLACRSCHTEHKGRDHDIMGLDRNVFNHDSTDYPLLGAHRSLSCETCHEKKGDVPAERRDAPTDCFSCHEKNDRHTGKLGTKCADCHSEESWAGAKFDHSKTEYPLVGKHVEVACGRCHPGAMYKGVPTRCNDCHQLDDAHQGSFGVGCATCHTPKSFKESGSFDHAKETKFPLTGRHDEIKCQSCHIEAADKVKLSLECNSCHEVVDTHRGLLGPDCKICHTTTRWDKYSFDHNEATRFPLKGQHAQVSCTSCHRGTPKREARLSTCASCHAEDDVHRGQLESSCADCHNESSWTQKLFFEHDLSRFPLLGLHATTACEDCHESPRFRDAKIKCAACHQKDDVHKRKLGNDCARCHNPNGWRIWVFDHSAESRFPLNGRHAGLGCTACHTEASGDAVRASKDCVSCHSREDPHRGRFGENCEACHSEESWKNARMLK